MMLVFIALAAGHAVAAAQPQRITEAFQRDTFDKTLWTIERLGAKVDATGGQLKIAVPKGPAGRPPVGLQSRFRIEGDFDIRAGYAITAWPMPKKEWINVTIFIEGADGAAAVFRTNHSKVGSGYALWHEAADKTRPGAWKQVATKDTKGTLRLKRSGDQLRFLFGGPAESAPRELGAISYGTSSITALRFQVIVPETLAPVEVAFGTIEIEAERLIGPKAPAGSMFGRRAWLGIGATVAVAAALAAFLWLRAGRSKRGSPQSGWGGA
jgi:hypothetical protein